MPTPAFAIETIGLSKSYGTQRAVRGVNLRVPHGAIFGLLGSPGAGKTTLINLLSGRETPTGGQGSVMGYNLLRERNVIRTITGIAGPRPPLLNDLSFHANLRLLAIITRRDRDSEIDDALYRAGLSAYAHTPVNEAPRVAQRRLAVAAALLNRPRVLFLDEITDDLNPEGITELHHLINQLNAEGLTIVLASRRLREIEQICTHVAVLGDGELRAQGPLASLIGDNDTLIITAEPLSVVIAVATRMGFTVTPTGAGALQVSAEPEDAPRLVTALVNAGVQIFAVTPQYRSLAQRFPDLAETDQNERNSRR